MRPLILICLLFSSFTLQAETINLQKAIDLALASDPRIDEKRAFSKYAKALLDEANSSGGFRFSMMSTLAITTGLDGGFYKDGEDSCSVNCESRDDTYDFDDGLSLWGRLQLSVIKPLSTFGRLESYQQAAEQNILVKNEDIVLQQDAIRLDVVRAYNGYLTARDSRYLLEGATKQLKSALKLVNEWLDEDKGSVKLGDRFALEAGASILQRYKAEASGLEAVALAGLSVLTGLKVEDIEVEDRRLRATELPLDELQDYVDFALQNRPEFKQLEAGLSARRALVKAKKSENKPISFIGLASTFSYAPGRDTLDNPHIFDTFNHAAISPLIGLKWDWEGGASNARVDQAKAELDALVHKSSFAQRGVPFQVAEQYHLVHSQFEQMQAMKNGAKSARRWMISAYTDFEAGLEEADKIITAMQLYVLAYADYLKIMNDYNNSVSKLYSVTGNYDEI